MYGFVIVKFHTLVNRRKFVLQQDNDRPYISQMTQKVIEEIEAF